MQNSKNLPLEVPFWFTVQSELGGVPVPFWFTIQDLERLTGFRRWVLRRMLLNRGIIQAGARSGCRIFVLSAVLAQKWPEFLGAVLEARALELWNNGGADGCGDGCGPSLPRFERSDSFTIWELSELTGASRHCLRRFLLHAGAIRPDGGKKIRVQASALAAACPDFLGAVRARIRAFESDFSAVPGAENVTVLSPFLKSP